MLKSCLRPLTFVFLFSLVLNVAFAGNNVLTKIGTMDLDGNVYSEWWYTEENPTLSGIAAAGATVEIDINGTKSEVTADSSGNWSFATGALPTGDHAVIITTGGEVYSFTLHTGQTVPEGVGSGSGGESDVPATGYNQILWMGVGLVLFSVGYTLLKTSKVTTVFEKKILSEFK